jgi:hypothetical protein
MAVRIAAAYGKAERQRGSDVKAGVEKHRPLRLLPQQDLRK